MNINVGDKLRVKKRLSRTSIDDSVTYTLAPNDQCEVLKTDSGGASISVKVLTGAGTGHQFNLWPGEIVSV